MTCKSPHAIFFLCAVVLGFLALFPSISVRLPGNDQGYEPVQPIAFSHRLHAGELAIDCQYCHYPASSGPVAGIPPASVCMNCHEAVTAGSAAQQAERALALAEGREPRPVISAELRKLYDALGLDEDRKPVPGAVPEPIRWVRVHNLPHFVAFDHSIHVARGIDCQACHGPVETMERVRQVPTLSMGWCIDCHRANQRDGFGAIDPALGHPRHPFHVSTDCSVCHF